MVEDSHKNAYISESFHIVEGVFVRMLIEDGVPYGQMVLVVDRNTKFDQINKNRKLIFKFLNSMESNIGSDLNYKYEENLYALLQWHEQGIGWEKLAIILNYLCYVLTYCAYTQRNDVHAEISEELQETISEPSFVASLGGAGISFIFLSIGMTLYELNTWMKRGYEYLAGDRFDFEITEDPIKWERVRDKVRYFHDGIEANKIWISEEDSHWNSLEFTIYIMSKKGFFTKLLILLDKEQSVGWKRNKTFLLKWMNGIFVKWENSQDPKIIRFRETVKMGKS